MRRIIFLINILFSLTVFSQEKKLTQSRNDSLPDYLILYNHGKINTDIAWKEDTMLCNCMKKVVFSVGLNKEIENNKAGVFLCDISTDVNKPVYAEWNSHKTIYAASIVKTIVLLALFQFREDAKMGRIDASLEKAKSGLLDKNFEFKPNIKVAISAMIRRSSNENAALLINLLGFPYINSVSWQYGLYSIKDGGGLWLGKSYGNKIRWYKDPLCQESHAASPYALSKYFVLLAQNRLVDSLSTLEMKNELGNSEINFRFKKALESHYPGTRIYRKTGTFESKEGMWAHEAALVERNGMRYVVAVMCEGNDCIKQLENIIIPLDACIVKHNSK